MESEQYTAIAFDLIKKSIGNGNVLAVRTSGSSMFPLIKNNDCVLIQKVDVDEIRHGDIIAFQCSSRIVLHRVVRITEGYKRIFITKGDFALDVSLGVDECQIIGKVSNIGSFNLESSVWRVFNIVISRLSNIQGSIVQIVGRNRSYRRLIKNKPMYIRYENHIMTLFKIFTNPMLIVLSLQRIFLHNPVGYAGVNQQ
ncbi:MAG: signal peptidase I [Candidatus Altiarchaeota archaeon]